VAKEAEHALLHQLAVASGGIPEGTSDFWREVELLTMRMRDAYYHGLAFALPTSEGELGFAMDA
jgi:hypothetical protein